MKKEVVIIIAEDDEGHAILIERNLRRAGLQNEIMHLEDGQEVIDHFYASDGTPKSFRDTSFLLLLDIRMPRVDGIEVLRRIKSTEELSRLPIIMITTTDDPREVEMCHSLGCSNYVTKPIDYEKFVEAIRRLGLFLLIVEVPSLNTKKGPEHADRA